MLKYHYSLKCINHTHSQFDLGIVKCYNIHHLDDFPLYMGLR